jgi:MFS family permease
VKTKSVVLAVVVLGVLMGALDSTIVVLALPTIVEDLRTDLFTAVWVILVYVLEIAVLTTQFGRLGDSYGRAKTFNLGFIVFTLGSALAGVSPNAYFLIASRAVQALGASMMQANSGAIISDYFPPNERGKAFGYNSLDWNSGAILGIVLGGIITTYLGWRFVFYVNVPIGLVASYLGFRYVKDVNRVAKKLDVPGMALFGLSLSLVTYGASDLAGQGADAFNLSLIALGLALLLPFVLVELKAESRP